MRNKFNTSASQVNMDKLKDGDIIHLPTGKGVTKEQMIDAAAKARVIYISEQHDNIAAHKVQLEVIKELCKKHPGKIAVGMEMFRCSVQPELDRLGKGALPLADFNKLFDQQWTPNWREAYQSVLDYLHEKSIPVIGLKPAKETEDLVRGGKTSGPDVPELDMNDKHHRDSFLPFFSGEGVPPEVAERKYRMMVLWDEAMAAAVAKFLSDPANADKKLVVIAGVGHIGYGFGIPKRAARRVPHDYSIIIPASGNDFDESIPLSPGDYAVKVPYDKLSAKPQPGAEKGPKHE